MRICTWNLRRATRKSPIWNYFLELAPDLALLQEVSGIPDEVTDQFQVVLERAQGKSGHPQKFHTAILVRGRLIADIKLTTPWNWVNQELEYFKGNLVARLVELHNGQQLRVLSAHSPAWPIDRNRLDGIDVHTIKLKNNPDVWVTELLWAALFHAEQTAGPPWVVGGDLNSSETFDYLWRGGPRGNREILDRMKSLGFDECLRYTTGQLTPTFRNPRGGKVIHQLDHLFVTHPLIKQLMACGTSNEERVFGYSLSDHLPIIADFHSV